MKDSQKSIRDQIPSWIEQERTWAVASLKVSFQFRFSPILHDRNMYILNTGLVLEELVAVYLEFFLFSRIHSSQSFLL